MRKPKNTAFSKGGVFLLSQAKHPKILLTIPIHINIFIFYFSIINIKNYVYAIIKIFLLE